ncbi:HlyD family secretion protein [Paludisphaera rhizosphaerae]|uniref:HlyD family secretion protein n=1 Tax=Paludisphaera rhizosphaerae TaxID=2711216 RepID=UPI0013E9E6CE|nr:HlyD family efflux transporter periplasmic adaptor subunit [Paludisphaera rhizosphaerae]
MSIEDGTGGESPEPAKPSVPAVAAEAPPRLDVDDESAAELVDMWPRMRRVAADHRRLARWGVWLVGAVGVAVGAVVLGQFAYYRFTMSMTNDAFFESHIVHLAFQEGGVVTKVLVEEHDEVKAGQVLAEIDLVPLTREVDEAVAKRKAAEAMLEYEKATLDRLEQEHPRRVAVAQKELASADAAVAESEALLKMTAVDVDKAVNEAKADTAALQAALVNAQEEYDRQSQLFKAQSTPERTFQVATRELRAAQAKVEAAQAKVERAEADRAQVEIARRSLDQKVRAREKAAESLRLAELGDLEITVQKRQVALRAEEVDQAARVEATARTKRQNGRIVAPFDGVVVRRYRNPGDHAPLGSPVLSMYDPELVYVTAYLEEDRLEGVAPGNDVSLWVDAFPDELKGRVVWIGQATGANFSLLPRDITAGEFTKVTQRVPVRIAVERGPRWGQLRPGLSVTAAISHVPGDAAWAKAEAERERARGEIGVSPTSVPETFADPSPATPTEGGRP